MRPPDCYVCHLTLHDVPDDGNDYFTLVRFGTTDEAKMAPSRAMQIVGRTGHAYNAIWFCDEHLPLAREHQNRHVDDALAAIKANPGYIYRRRAGLKAKRDLVLPPKRSQVSAVRGNRSAAARCTNGPLCAKCCQGSRGIRGLAELVGDFRMTRGFGAGAGRR